MWRITCSLAMENPQKLRELQRLFLIEAVKYNVLPLDDRRVERFNADIAGRPTLIKGTAQRFFGGMGRLSENAVINVKNKSHAITAEVTAAKGGVEGVIIVQGGAFAGWAFYVKDGKPTYCYNFMGLQRFTITGNKPIPQGTHQVRMEFAYDGGGLAKGGAVTLYLDGKQIGKGRVERTVPLVFSADETCDIGSDTGTSVSLDYSDETSRFTGTINWVQLDLGSESADHLISADERIRVAMARQ
jgi:hypothetical protein